MMKVNFRDTLIIAGEKIEGDQKSVTLPFSHLSVRAIIVRKADGAILGALHRPGGKYALPGGAIDDGENAEQAIIRELEEENIVLVGSDQEWRSRLAVDYFQGYNELCLWYLFVVAGVEIDDSDELLDVQWIPQDEDPWYPQNREKMLIHVKRYFPDLFNQ
jgi:8-oxo-dGTP pyrophosphatase MutT (NUDIX family)